MTARLLIVGGGVLGTMHAKLAVDAGHSVIHLEREAGARGASVRNFGLVWVSGRAPGEEVELALRSRLLWEKVAADVPAVGFRANGSLTLATRPEELAVLEAVAERADAGRREFRMLDAAEVTAHNPAIRGGGGSSAAKPPGVGRDGELLGGLLCGRDATVEPRLVPEAVRRHLEATGRYTHVAGAEIVDVAERPEGIELTDAAGRRWTGDRVVLCTGAWHSGFAGRWLASEDAPVVRRVRLHMMQTAPLDATLTTSVADADSLRYYPAYDVPELAKLPPQEPERAGWAMQLLMAQRLDGGLTIGDTHLYDEPFGFDVEEAPYRLLTERAESLLGRKLPSIARRWSGVYSQLVPGADAETAGSGGAGLYLDRPVLPGVRLVTGPGGRGMTLAPVIAERTLTELELLA